MSFSEDMFFDPHGYAEEMLYFDNAATSWPKPRVMVDAMNEALSRPGSPGRSGYKFARNASQALSRARRTVATYLGIENPDNLIFQPSCTQSANLVFKGALLSGDRVLASSVEHNSVTRPLYELESRGVIVDWIDAQSDGSIDLECIRDFLSRNAYKAVVCQHGSNVTGVIHPIEEIGALAHAHDALMVVDGAQAGGHLSINLSQLPVDAWFCSGHKGLLGPSGVGVLYLVETLSPTPLVLGGTGFGGASHVGEPIEKPGSYESGTCPLALVVGLGASVGFLQEHEQAIINHADVLTKELMNKLATIDGISILGPNLGTPRLPIVSITAESIDSEQLAFELDARYDIAVRANRHCSPATHIALGTIDTGAVRFSIGACTTQQEIEVAARAVKEILATTH